MPHDRASNRKDDHVRLASEQAPPPLSPFDDVSFVHHALAGINANQVSLATTVAGSPWSTPFFINAMTGGSSKSGEINRALAIAAREAKVAIASGSISAALDNPTLAATFRVIREENPDGIVFANVGIERSVDDARRAIDLLQANALQVHVNAVQETVMPEGRRAFADWRSSLEALVAGVDVPIIVKEVGFGLSASTLTELDAIGIPTADVSGRGGTDFVRVENARRSVGDLDYLVGWGQSAVECLLDAPPHSPHLLASGGVRHPLDVVRALALGAQAVGVSGGFLRTVLDGGAEALAQQLVAWNEQLVSLFALLGAQNPGQLATHTDLIIQGATAQFCRARGIDITHFANRTSTKQEQI